MEQEIAAYSTNLFGGDIPEGAERLMNQFLLTTGVPLAVISGAMRLKGGRECTFEQLDTINEEP
jgi:hypothetical protein